MKNVGFAQGLYETSSTQKEVLGLLRVEPDGRKFRYAKAGSSALVAGKICIMAACAANHVDCDVAVAPSVGDTELTITLGATAATADQYKDGYLQVNDGTGEGTTYGIESNPAAASAGSLTIRLKDPLQVALATGGSSKVTLIPNPWNGTTVSSTEESGAAGIPLVAVPANNYYWSQTGGLAAVLSTAADGVGTVFSLDATAGGVGVQANYTMNLVGVAVGTVGVATDYKPIWLLID